ncbi:cytochrome-c peroxidase [Cyclonatronum proteinivorum]|nr:cytochrome c peroxidase [Cyclonatronum proteinivorum]
MYYYLSSETKSKPAMLLIVLISLIAVFGLLSCQQGADRTAEAPVTPHPLFEILPDDVEDPEDNIRTPERIDLGHKLFFEPKLSRSGIISCNSCHVVGAAGVDHRARAIGEGAQVGPRNSPTVFNAAFLKAQFWDGRAATLEEQAKGPIQAHVEMDLTPEEAINRLYNTGYMPYFEAAFPDEEEPLTFENLAKAIAAFERTLLTPGSPFDHYLAGNYEILNDQELRGLSLFQDAGCASCHHGPLLGGNLFMEFSHLGGEDVGRGAITGYPGDQFVFRVAPLRNVALTYPYFHDGSVATLEEAVSIMGHAQLNRDLNEQEVDDIVAFLNTLTGEFPMIAHPSLPRNPPAQRR